MVRSAVSPLLLFFRAVFGGVHLLLRAFIAGVRGFSRAFVCMTWLSMTRDCWAWGTTPPSVFPHLREEDRRRATGATFSGGDPPWLRSHITDAGMMSVFLEHERCSKGVFHLGILWRLSSALHILYNHCWGCIHTDPMLALLFSSLRCPAASLVDCNGCTALQ